MPGVVRPTLGNGTPRDIAQSFSQLQDFVDQLEADNADLRKQLAALPVPLTLEEIRTGLSANGAAPLDLTGLTGTPVTTP